MKEFLGVFSIFLKQKHLQKLPKEIDWTSRVICLSLGVNQWRNLCSVKRFVFGISVFLIF